MKFNNFLDKIGNTPLVKYGKFQDATIWLKLEGENPTGSLKDRTAKAIILDKIAKRELNRNTIALDSSSGNFACSMAYICKILGYGSAVVVKANIGKTYKDFLKYLGAEIIYHGDTTGEGNEYCKNELLKNFPEKYCFLNQMNNEVSKSAHQETAKEILRDLPDLKAVAMSMGTGCSLYGVSHYIKNKCPDIKIISSIGAPGKKIAGTYQENKDHISVFNKKIWEYKLVDMFCEVTYEKARDNSRKLSKNGFLVGLQTGGVLQAMFEAIKKLQINGDVVVVSGDTAWKNFEKLL